MRTRNVSTRKSGRISGQGFTSGPVAFLVRLAHAARENRVMRQAVMRIKPARRAKSRCRSAAVIVHVRLTSTRRPTFKQLRPGAVAQFSFHYARTDARNGRGAAGRREAVSRSDRTSMSRPMADPGRADRTPPAMVIAHCIPGDLRQVGGSRVRRFVRNGRHVAKSSVNMSDVYRLRPGTRSARRRWSAGVIGCTCRRFSGRQGRVPVAQKSMEPLRRPP